MRSYFFIPGTKYENIPLIQDQGVDEIIIDLEDAVRTSERERIIQQLSDSPESRDYWIRVPLRGSFEQDVDPDIFRYLLGKGFSKYILPKLRSAAELEQLMSDPLSHNKKYILLIEHPKMLLELYDKVLARDNFITGVGLGSHDMASWIGAKHTLKNLEYPRQKVLYLAKASGIESIDIASMELKNQAQFEEELKDGLEKGYDAKFLIHPWQLKLFNNLNYYTPEEVQWAQKVVEEYNKVKGNEEFAPIVINNEVIERPHIKRALKIMDKIKQHGSK